MKITDSNLFKLLEIMQVYSTYVKTEAIRRSWKAVLWIQIRRIRMFKGIQDPDLSLFCKDPDPDPSINKQKS